MLFVLGALFLLVCGMVAWLSLPALQGWLASNKVGIVEIRGVIRDSRPFLEQLARFRGESSVRAVVLRIESPGGGVGPSQEIYREVRRTAERKPVVASLGGIAASGGYYAACGAHRILASPGTVTGSIGVLAPFPDFRGLFEKIGYGKTVIKSGRFKDLGDPGREMTPEEKRLVQEMVETVHRQFMEDVAKGRKLSLEEVKSVADGRIMAGETALENKLVDELGNFRDAVGVAARLGGVEGEPVLVYGEERGFSLLGFLFGKRWKDELGSRWESWAPVPRYRPPSFLGR